NELEMFTRLRIGAPLPTPAPPIFPGAYSALSAAVSDIKKLAAGAGLLVSWDMSGLPPVPGELSASRAKVCLACPLNSTAKLEQWNTVPVAMSLNKRLTRLEGMKLRTPSDNGLGLCDGIYAPLSKLVHCPISIISSRLKFQQVSELHPQCWIKADQNAI
ncbi:MAG TPA: hypothetical protein VGA09_04155, partial [Candidatus Binatia bacterium]